MVTTKKTAIEYTKEMRRELKCFTTKTISKGRQVFSGMTEKAMKKKRSDRKRYMENSKMTEISPFLSTTCSVNALNFLISYYLQCKPLNSNQQVDWHVE